MADSEIIIERINQRPEARQYIERFADNFKWEFKHYAIPNPKYLAESWSKLMFADTSGNTRCYVALLDGIAVGILLGSIQPDLITGIQQGLEYFWFVQKEFRKQGIGKQLLTEFEKDAFLAGAMWVVIGWGSLCEPDQRFEAYKKLGYRPHGGTFYREIR